MPQLPEPLTADDLTSFRYLSDAQISPDGERVAFVMREMDPGANDYRSLIWIVPFDGSSEARPFTSGPGQDASPRWSPDGRWLAFLSDRAVEKGERRKPKALYLMPTAGGEARRLTVFTEDCADLAWSPKGDSLVLAVKDERDPAAPSAEDAVRVYDRVRYKSDEGGYFDLRRRHLWLVCLDGTPPRRITDGDWDDAQPSYSPDGTRIAFVSNRTGERDGNNVSDIWVVPVGGGAPARVTTGVGSFGNPSWSPDGERIACYGIAEAIGSAARNVGLWVFPAAGGDGADALADWDRTVGSVVMSDMRGQPQTLAPAWTADGARTYFVGTDHGSANLYSASVAGGDVRPATTGAHQVVSVSFDGTTHRLAAVLAGPVEPGEIAAGIPGDTLRRLTGANDAFLSERFVAVPERVEFAGADGWPIEGWLLRPRGFDETRKWPLVLEVHGGPHAAYGNTFFHEFQVLAGRGYAVLYTNPRGSHGYGEAFVGACIADWGGKDYEDLMAAVDHAIGWGWVDERRLYVTGGSYGGFMTNWIVGHTTRFRAAVAQRSISNNVSAFGTSDIGWHFWEHEMGGATPWQDGERLVKRSPLTYVTAVTTPLLLLHAERDLRCPIEQAEQLFVALKVLGREAVFVRYQDDNHDLTRAGKPRNRIDHCRRIADWFDSHP